MPVEELQNRSRSRHSEWLIYAGGGGLGKVEDEGFVKRILLKKAQVNGLNIHVFRCEAYSFNNWGSIFFGVNAKCHRVIERFRFFSTSFQVSKDRLFRFFRRQLDACSQQCSADGSSDAAEFWRLWRSRLLQLDVIAVVRLEGVSRSNSNEGRQGIEEGEGQGYQTKVANFLAGSYNVGGCGQKRNYINVLCGRKGLSLVDV